MGNIVQNLQLDIRHSLQTDILELKATELHRKLSGPTLFHLDGINPHPLFVSVLLHGHEDTGWEAMRRYLMQLGNTPLPRAISLFIGNVDAAREGKRKLDSQPDFNRVWAGGDSPEARLVQSVLEEMQARQPFASIDIHNNTGRNPHYACINRLAPEFLNLARIFSRIIVYFIQPEGVQSQAFAGVCPAITVECGQPGDEYGIEQAMRLIETAVQMEVHDEDYPDLQHYDLYHTFAQIKVSAGCSFSFDDSPADIRFIQGLESLNFEEINEHSHLAQLDTSHPVPLTVTSEQGEDIFQNTFEIKDGSLVNITPLIPSMLTTNREIVKQDCLCYLMERYDLSRGEKQKHHQGPTV